MAAIDYEKSFKKLVEQIKMEIEWSEAEVMAYNNWKKYKKSNVEAGRFVNNYRRYQNAIGMLAGYRSILELAEKLEKGEFFEN